MERFWRSLKKELVHHQHYAARADLPAAIHGYTESFYDRRWRYLRVDNIAPTLFAEKFSAQAQWA